MQFFICKAKKRCWTHKAGREALNVEAGDSVRITHKNSTITQAIRRAPLSASRVLRAVHTATGALGIAVDSSTLSQLGCRPGDQVEVVNLRAVEEARPAAPRNVSSSSAAGTMELNGRSLKEALNGLRVGQALKVSESAAKSGAYSAAKALGIKIKKTSATTVERVS